MSLLRPDSAHRETIRHLFGLGSRFEAERARLAADRNISDVGRRGQEAAFAKTLVRDIVELTRPLRRAKADISAKRAALQPKPIDRSDVVAELQRRELREFVRSLPFEKRLEAVFGLSDAHLEAITSAPSILSGLPQDRYDKIVEMQREKQFGAQIRALEAHGEEHEAVESAAVMVRRDLQKATGLGANDFSALEKSFEN